MIKIIQLEFYYYSSITTLIRVNYACISKIFTATTDSATITSTTALNYHEKILMIVACLFPLTSSTYSPVLLYRLHTTLKNKQKIKSVSRAKKIDISFQIRLIDVLKGLSNQMLQITKWTFIDYAES